MPTNELHKAGPLVLRQRANAAPIVVVQLLLYCDDRRGRNRPELRLPLALMRQQGPPSYGDDRDVWAGQPGGVVPCPVVAVTVAPLAVPVGENDHWHSLDNCPALATRRPPWEGASEAWRLPFCTCWPLWLV